MTYYTYTHTPVGDLLLISDGINVFGMYWTVDQRALTPDSNWTEDASYFRSLCAQLEEYFQGMRRRFEIPVKVDGTPFQRQVWRELSETKYGHTKSYQQIADAIGRPHAARAVGAAVGRNPLSIIIPCHRAVASSGSLTGYAGGVESKRLLLQLEGALI